VASDFGEHQKARWFNIPCELDDIDWILVLELLKTLPSSIPFLELNPPSLEKKGRNFLFGL